MKRLSILSDKNELIEGALSVFIHHEKSVQHPYR